MAELLRIATPAQARLDVVFVHGLGGDKSATWQADGTANTFWPKWLAEELPDVAISSLGYEASPSAWLGHAMPLTDRANNVLALLEAEGFGARPLVFICHSLGGLLVKQLLRSADTLGNPAWQAIPKQTKTVVFLATPHAGARLADYLNALGVLARATVAIEDLRANEPHLRDLATWYSNNAARLGIETRAYFETRDTKGLRVVDESSANPGISGVVPVGLDADHAAICKPADREALLYKSIRRWLAELAATLAPPLCQEPPGSRLADDSPCYIPREADRRIAAMAQGAPRSLILKAPHHFGKSSLLLRFRAQCIESGQRAAYLDLNTFGEVRALDFPTFAEQFARALLEELELAESLTLPVLSNARALTAFMQNQLLPAVPGPLALILDEADQAIGADWQEDFYGELRGWDSRRSHPGKKTTWGRLGLAFGISTDPRMLIENGWQSPFNFTDPIVLSPFNRADLDVFNTRYGAKLDATGLDRLQQLLGGHPYLTSLAFYRLAAERMALDQLLDKAADDMNGPFREHLRDVLRRLDKGKLLQVVKSLPADAASLPRNVAYRLEAAGLVRLENGRLLASNETYARFFKAIP